MADDLVDADQPFERMREIYGDWADTAKRNAALAAVSEHPELSRAMRGAGEGPAEDTAVLIPTPAQFQKFSEDRLEFEIPIVERIDAELLKKHNVELPPNLTDSVIVRLRAPLMLWDGAGWPYNRLELALKFDHDATERTRRPVQVISALPEQRFVEYFKAGAEVFVGVDGNLSLEVAEINASFAQVGGAQAGGIAKAGADLMARFRYGIDLSYAVIKLSPLSGQEIVWRLSGRQFGTANSPSFIVLLSVPSEATKVTVQGIVQASRTFDRGLRKLLGWFVDAGAPKVAEMDLFVFDPRR